MKRQYSKEITYRKITVFILIIIAILSFPITGHTSNQGIVFFKWICFILSGIAAQGILDQISELKRMRKKYEDAKN